MPPLIGIALLVLLGLIVGLLAYIAARPADFRLERSAEVGAPVEIVFGLINDFHQWVRWSPWERKDPALRRSYDGPFAGPGAIYAWAGNRNIGEGRMTIIAIVPAESITIKLEFLKPIKATHQAHFKLAPSGAATRVTWSMEGRNNFIGKAISLVMSMEKMVGPDFEQGLANLDAAARIEAERVG